MVERANQTVQSRLKPELRLHNITTIEDANKYLREVFVPKFNDKFGQNIRKFESAFDDSPSSEKINYTLAILSPRTFDSGSAISFKNHYYQATDASNKLICFAKGTKCLVIQALDSQLLVTVDEEVYALTEIPKNDKVSPDLDFEAKKKNPRKKYIPPMSHPWKRDSFIKQQRKAHKYYKFT